MNIQSREWLNIEEAAVDAAQASGHEEASPVSLAGSQLHHAVRAALLVACPMLIVHAAEKLEDEGRDHSETLMEFEDGFAEGLAHGGELLRGLAADLA